MEGTVGTQWSVENMAFVPVTGNVVVCQRKISSDERKKDLGCSQLTSINCNSSQYHSFIELRNTTYFAFELNHELASSILRFEGKKLEDCKRTCLRDCSCKAVVFRDDSDGATSGSCLLLTDVFSLIDEEGTDNFLWDKFKYHCLLCSFQKEDMRFHKGWGFSILPGMLTRFTYNELKIITEDFSRKLGEGGFGAVYEGALSNGTKIAVKRLDGLGHVMESFVTEVKIVGGIHHVNLVKLIGFCAEKRERLLIYEHMPEDIHLNIKPQNILLDQNFNAKISDFGISKLIEIDKSKIETRMRGTRGYLAPEWLKSVITKKVDVYAFGIVLLEVLCGRKYLDSSQANEDIHLLSAFERKAEQQQLMAMVDKNNEDMQMHKEAVTEMMGIAAWCLQVDFTKRPSMSLVVKALEGLVSVETNMDYDFTSLPEVGADNQQGEDSSSSLLPSILS
ncbi:putative G-type lectin S-receptor-like serine/threonine-protein kinase SD2-5-like [Capsicum annuum]|nr:putative G-type lectin S-receptor-like serine/threonine-protein kinase SD2-5-like [Capsicum annuum]